MRVVHLLILLTLTASLLPTPAKAAEPMIEISGTSSSLRNQTLTVRRLVTSPAFSQNQGRIQEIAEARLKSISGLPETYKQNVAGFLRELPFHRILDLEISFLSGIPDIIGVCLEGFPTNNFAIEACASSALFVSSLALNAKYRWDLVIYQNQRGGIHQLQLGPGFGLRHMEALCFDACRNTTLRADLLASLEYTYWISRYFGLQAQLDGGVDFQIMDLDQGYGSAAVNTPVLPLVKIMLGVAF
jgi:hypothetical protein